MAKVQTELSDLQLTPREAAPQNVEVLRNMIQAIIDPIALGYLGQPTIGPLNQQIRQREDMRRAIPIETQDRMLNLRKEQMGARLTQEKSALEQMLLKQRAQSGQYSLMQQQDALDQLQNNPNLTDAERTQYQQILAGGIPQLERVVRTEENSRQKTVEWVMDNVANVNDIADKDERRAAAIDWMNVYDPNSRAQRGLPEESKIKMDIDYDTLNLIKGFMARESSEKLEPGDIVGRDYNDKPVIQSGHQKDFLKTLVEKIGLPRYKQLRLNNREEYERLLDELSILLPDIDRKSINIALNEDAQRLKKELDIKAKEEFTDRLLRGKE